MLQGMSGRERMLADLTAAGVRDPRVLAAFRRVPRERFVPEHLAAHAYRNEPLPIGAGQTISQPVVVGLMLQAARLDAGQRVLEVGTGSGYQAALIAELVQPHDRPTDAATTAGAGRADRGDGRPGHVVSLERVESLAAAARQRLQALGYDVAVEVANGAQGWPPAAPFDAIVVAAAAPRVPDSLLDQLADGGRLVIPVGSLAAQDLALVERAGDTYRWRMLCPVRFVPLVGESAWSPHELPPDAAPGEGPP